MLPARERTGVTPAARTESAGRCRALRRLRAPVNLQIGKFDLHADQLRARPTLRAAVLVEPVCEREPRRVFVGVRANRAEELFALVHVTASLPGEVRSYLP